MAGPSPPSAPPRAGREAAPPLVEALRAALAPSGLNVLGVASVDAYDAAVGPARRSSALHPGARSIVVVGSGGPASWRRFLADLRETPAHLTRERHPLEAFVQREIAAADRLLDGAPRSWFFAASDAPVQLDFRLLAHLAGLGVRSRLQLVMHPVHGTWMGLRAACFSALELETSPAVAVNPCDGCAAPCAEACPGGAFPSGTWDVDRCARFHLESDRCGATCHARLACPEGAASRYDADQIRYHTDGVAGRRWLRAHVGVSGAEDRHEGNEPMWIHWRERIDATGR